MTAYILKRLLAMIPTLLGITVMIYFMIRLAPGNPVTLKIQAAQGLKAEALSKDVMDQTLKLYGLKVDLPKGYEDFIHKVTLKIYHEDPKEDPMLSRRVLEKLGQIGIQYKDWLVGLTQLNFGMSFKDHRPVLEKIKEALPITLSLNLLEFIIIYFISIPLGVFTAVRRQSISDKTIMVLLFILYSLPSFWVATLLLTFLASGAHFDWFPLGGLLSDGAEGWPFLMKLGNVAWHLVLPVTAMVYGSFAYLTRFSRATMLENIKKDYVRTALAKGVAWHKAIWRHAFRNSLIPIITLLGTLLPALLGGSVIIEQIFSIRGMGRLAFESALNRDYPTIMAIATIAAVLTLVGLLLSDLAYAWVDPRISFKGKEYR